MNFSMLICVLVSQVYVAAANSGPQAYKAVLSQARHEIPLSSDERSPQFTYLEFVVLEPTSLDGVILQLFLRPSRENDELLRGFAPLLWTTKFLIELEPTPENGALVAVKIGPLKRADSISSDEIFTERRFKAEIYQRGEVPLAKAEVTFENNLGKRTIELPKGFIPPNAKRSTLEVMSVGVKKFTSLNSEAKKEISLFILTEQSSGEGGRKVPIVVASLGEKVVIYYEKESVRNGFLSVNELKYLGTGP